MYTIIRHVYTKHQKCLRTITTPKKRNPPHEKALFSLGRGGNYFVFTSCFYFFFISCFFLNLISFLARKKNLFLLAYFPPGLACLLVLFLFVLLSFYLQNVFFVLRHFTFFSFLFLIFHKYNYFFFLIRLIRFPSSFLKIFLLTS